MSAFLDRVHQLLDEAKAEFAHLLGHGDAAVQAAAKNAVERIDAAKAQIEADAPKLATEAGQDAAAVVHTAETEGVQPAEVEAGADAVKLAQDAVHDVSAALEDGNKPAEPQPAHSPPQTAAVIAGETAVADSGQHQG